MSLTQLYKGWSVTDNMIGKVFGRLQVLELFGTSGKAQHKKYLCKCECGNQKHIIGASLRAGRTQSCGCLSAAHCFTSDRVKTHGKSRTRTYSIWNGMKGRCSPLSKGKARKNYYAKGIRVCDRWLTFDNFFSDMGEAPNGMSLERLDGNRNYEPENCVWATPKTQANNMSSNHIVEFKGKRQTIAQWADELGLSHNTFAYRLYRAFAPGKHFEYASPRARPDLEDTEENRDDRTQRNYQEDV